MPSSSNRYFKEYVIFGFYFFKKTVIKTGTKPKKNVPPDPRLSKTKIHPFQSGSFCVICEQTNRQKDRQEFW